MEWLLSPDKGPPSIKKHEGKDKRVTIQNLTQ